MSDFVKYEDTEDIRIITIDRPDKKNAVNEAMLLDICTLIENIENDEKIRSIIITSQGDKVFSAGYDISSNSVNSKEDLLKIHLINYEPGNQQNVSEDKMHPLMKTSQVIMDSSKIIIAAINGHIYGGTLEILLNCDFRFFSDDSVFCMPPAKLGIFYNYNGLKNFINKIGIPNTKKIFLTGEKFDSKDAIQMGLVDFVYNKEKIVEEAKELGKKINEYLNTLKKKEKLIEIVKNELVDIQENYSDSRRTSIGSEAVDIEDEDLVAAEDMVITVSHRGYIKRVPVKTYRAQRRGGKGRQGMSTREEDFVNQVFIANTRTPVLFFSSKGKVYQMKVFKLPEFAPNARGKPMIGIFPLDKDENITTVLPLPKDTNIWEELNIVFATSKGSVRRNALSDFIKIQSSGKIAMKLSVDDRLVGVHTCSEKTDDIFLSTREGKCIRFAATDIRKFSGRNSVGVRGIRIKKDDEVISMYILKHAKFTINERDDYLRISNAIRRKEIKRNLPFDKLKGNTRLDENKYKEMENTEEFILSVTENGFGKISSAYEYKITRRGGQGIANMALKKKIRKVVASFPVEEKDDIMLIAGSGKLIRSPVKNIRIAGRTTQGVTLFKVEKDAKVLSVATIKDLNLTDEQTN